MLLLYQFLRSPWYDLILYLHSTMLLLYLIPPARPENSIIFTFHYASTLSETEVPKIVDSVIFTFHYASTLSDHAAHLVSVHLGHLHSTMLLLYQIPRRYGSGRISIYIPLCFYFISFVKSYNYEDCEFTFHYASTLSRSKSVTS